MEMSWLPWLLTFLGMIVEMSEGVRRRRGMSYEDMLVNQVLESYRMRSIHARPVLKFNDTLTVKFAVQLTQIMGLDEKDQVLTLNIWDQLEWYDKQIHWNKDEYGGVNDVRVPCDKIWTPDIKLQNYADDRLEEHREALCIVQYDGRVYHVPQVIYRSSCLIDVYVFPFDVQNCTLKFSSWTYAGDKLDLRFYEDKSWIDLTEYVESNSWSIIDVPAYRHVSYYSCCNHPYVDLQYHIIIQRRSAMYNYMLILPCVLLTSITLILFFIPPESPAKMQLGLAVFIAFFLLWKLLEQNLPPGTIYMPLLGTYYCLNMVLITLSSFLNVFIVDLTTHGLRTSSPPKLTKFMFNYLAKCLFMGDLVKPFRTPKTKTRTPKDGNLGKMEDNKWNHEADASNEAISSLQRETSSTSQGGTGGILGEIELKLTELREFTRHQKQRLRDRDRKDNIARQWKAVALVLDRIFFIIYLFMIIASLCYTLPVLTAYKYKFNTTVLDKAFGGG